eukprot:TRINITY_DN35997_c0_g1_i1.p3 TRINITY_DN35997_c0_g1~~TRINITY_DN35997_c0_g1_i1.p3  ORF type:complete len:121 (+),score=36.45 TRINITY_DN35997_c0_g1_i1:42-404(+)
MGGVVCGGGVFFFSSRRRHTRCREVSWARRCVQETESKQKNIVKSPPRLQHSISAAAQKARAEAVLQSAPADSIRPNEFRRRNLARRLRLQNNKKPNYMSLLEIYKIYTSKVELNYGKPF